MMRSRQLSLGSILGLGLAGLGLAACGDDGGGGAGPDAAIDSPSGDTAAPQLVSSSPAVEEMRVGVLESLSVVFDEALDPATVLDGLSLTVGFMPERVLGTTSYDPATWSLTFVPDQPLVNGNRYQLRVGATIADVAGNAFAGATIPFHTYVNETTRRVSRLTSGVVNGWSGYTLDADGRAIKDLGYTGAGEDSVWLNSDDHIGSRFEVTYTAEGGIHEERSYHPGADLMYETADDVLHAVTVHTYDAEARETGHTNYSDPGTDATWGTADDVIAGYYVQTWEGGQRTRTIAYTGAGTDGVWRTADDTASTFFVRTFDQHRLVREVRYQAGPDLLPFTADDVTVSYVDHSYTNGYLSGSLHRTAGVDGVWFTADDGHSAGFKLDRDGSGLLIDYQQLAGPGIDGVWLTADDLVAARNEYNYESSKLQSASTSLSGPGMDGTWGTADDVILNHSLTTYDALGNRTTSRTFGHPGNDGLWKTLDDRVTSEIEYDPAH